MSRPEIGELRVPEAHEIHEDELAGGLHAVAVRRPNVPMVEVRIAFPVGAELVARAARPIVLAESLFAGTAERDRAGIAAAAERLGGSLGSSLDGDRFDVYASVLAPRLGELLALLAEVLSGATYPAEEVEADRDRMAEETLISLSQPDVIASEALRARMYGDHPYGAPIPRPAALRAVEPGKVRELHPSLLRPASGHLVLVGDLEPKDAFSIAAEALGPWLAGVAAGTGPDVSLPAVAPPTPGHIELVDRPGSVQSNIRLSRLAPGRGDPDWPATSLANLILGGMFASRLVENLRERHGYTYSPHTAIHHGRASSAWVVEAEVGSDVTAASLVETRYEVGRMAIDGVTDSELESARRYSLGTFTFTTSTQGGLAGLLSTLALTGVGPGYLTSHPAAVAAATRQQVGEAARRHLAPSQLVTVVVGEAETVAEPLAAIDEVVVTEPAGDPPDGAP